jgi:hypothetical protein
MHLYVTRNPSGFDYGFRPTSYFDNLDPTTLIAASILGEERRKDVLERIASGDFDPVVWGEWLTESKLDGPTRLQIGAAHPALMGGEYLPSFDGEEIEIARVVLASVTQDVISVRASRSGDRIKYRVVDEYDAKFTLTKDWSFKPLTFAELIHLIDGAQHEDDEHTGGAVFSHVHYYCLDLCEFESIRTFIDVSSSFYPEVASYYKQVIIEYLDEVTPRDEDDIEEDD